MFLFCKQKTVFIFLLAALVVVGGFLLNTQETYGQSAPTCTLTPSPSSVLVGETSALTWTTTDGPSTCTATGDDGWSGSKDYLGGSDLVGPLFGAGTHNYALSCININGTGSCSASVNVAASPTPTANIQVEDPLGSGTYIEGTATRDDGQSAKLRWQVTSNFISGTTECRASSDWTGSKLAAQTPSWTEETRISLSGPSSYNYVIECSNDGFITWGSDSASVNVTAPGDVVFTACSNGTCVSTNMSGVGTRAPDLVTTSTNIMFRIEDIAGRTSPADWVRFGWFSSLDPTPAGDTSASVPPTYDWNQNPSVWAYSFVGTSAENYEFRASIDRLGSPGGEIYLNGHVRVDILPPPPSPLPPSVVLVATPSSGAPPLTVSLTADTYDTAAGSIIYEFDCLNNGAPFDFTISTAATSYTAVNVCTYPAAGTYTAFVQITDSLGFIAQDTTPIGVDMFPPTVDLKINGSDTPGAVADGSTISLTWTTTNIPTSCTASNAWSGPKGTAASNGPELDGPLTGPVTRTYEIMCSNGDGSDTDSVTVIVDPPPPPSPMSVSLAVSPSTGNAPFNPDLIATVSGGSGFYTYEFDCTNVLPYEFTSPFTMINPYTYSGCSYGVSGVYTALVRVTDDMGNITQDTVSFSVGPFPPTVDLKINGSDTPGAVADGSTISLTWTTTNIPTSCTASNAWSGPKGTAASNGPELDGPLTGPVTRTYEIMCSNGDGSDTDSVTITINPPFSPGIPCCPNPANGAINISIFTNLDWGDAPGATNYDVYWSTCPLSDPTPDNTAASFLFLGGSRAYDTQYCWQVFAKNTNPLPTAGPPWTFRTELPPLPTCTISSDRAVILQGQSINITWACAGIIDTITLTGNPPPPTTMPLPLNSDSLPFSPQATTEYTVEACNVGGCAPDSVTVGVYVPRIREVIPKL